MNHYQAILRKFPRLMQGGVRFFEELHGLSADPEAFAARAPQCPVFRVENEWEENR